MHCLLCDAEEIIVYFMLACDKVAWLRITVQILLENDAYSTIPQLTKTFMVLLKWQMEKVGSICSTIGKIFWVSLFLFIQKTICKSLVLEIY